MKKRLYDIKIIENRAAQALQEENTYILTAEINEPIFEDNLQINEPSTGKFHEDNYFETGAQEETLRKLSTMYCNLQKFIFS